MIRRWSWKTGMALIVMGVMGSAYAELSAPWSGTRGWEPQGAYCRLFDTHAVVTVNGVVQRVEKIVPMKGMGYGIHMIVKTAAGPISVHLGPAWYVEQQPVKFQGRDIVEVTGSRVPCDGKPIILATHVTKGGQTVTYRELSGLPAWAGWGH